MVAWRAGDGRRAAPPAPSDASGAADADEGAEAGEDDEASNYQSGLLAAYAGADGLAHRRLEEQVAFEWPAGSPDRRVAPGAFRARFSGRLQVQVPGEYRLFAFAAGRVRVELAGKEVVSGAVREPGWLDGEPIELEYGFHPLVVDYQRTDEPAQIALFWQGPQFQLEPLAARWLFHEKKNATSEAFERSARLVRALRCAACHEMAGEREPLAAPALDCLTRNLSRAWLVDWLAEAVQDQPVAVHRRASRRMPHFGFDRQAAADVADYLFSVSEDRYQPPPKVPPPAPAKRTKSDKAADDDKPAVPSIEQGAELVRSRGCLACHRVGSLGSEGLFGGGELTRIAYKRPDDFYARWLTMPAAINRDARMPAFALGPFERQSVSLYLQTLKSPPPPAEFSGPTNIERGRALVRQAGCANCHRLPKAAGIEPMARLKPFDPASLDGRSTCLDAPDAARGRPGFRLLPDERQAVIALVTETTRTEPASPWQDARDLLAERNCLACHARGLAAGISPQLPAVAEADNNLRAILPALVPPALHGVGDKLIARALEEAITRSAAPRQPWLRVEMPRYRLPPEETAALVRHFVAADRVPERPADGQTPCTGETQSAATLEAAGAAGDGDGLRLHELPRDRPLAAAKGGHQRARREPAQDRHARPPRVVRSLGAQPGADGAADGDAGGRAAGARRARRPARRAVGGRVVRRQPRRLHAAAPGRLARRAAFEPAGRQRAGRRADRRRRSRRPGVRQTAGRGPAEPPQRAVRPGQRPAGGLVAGRHGRRADARQELRAGRPAGRNCCRPSKPRRPRTRATWCSSLVVAASRRRSRASTSRPSIASNIRPPAACGSPIVFTSTSTDRSAWCISSRNSRR